MSQDRETSIHWCNPEIANTALQRFIHCILLCKKFYRLINSTNAPQLTFRSNQALRNNQQESQSSCRMNEYHYSTYSDHALYLSILTSTATLALHVYIVIIMKF